jgi:hypothetical protein
MERTIKNQKKQLLKTGIEGHWNLDEDRETFWEAKESPANEREDHLDDGDLEYINVILNSFSRQNCNHKNSTGLKLESFTPKDVLTRALAPMRMPREFNLNFNQNLTSHGSKEDHFSYFSNVEEEGPTELGDYFYDDEEDDNWDKEDLSSESNPWSHTDFNDPEENFQHSAHTLSEWDPQISGLETIDEATFEGNSEANKLHCISCLSEETKLAFSTWRLFIPHEHAFRNCAAPSQLSHFSSQASSSQEPTLTQISAISTSIEWTSAPMKPTSPQLVTSLSQPKDWPSFKLATRPFTPTWTKLWTESTETSNRAENWRTEFQDQPEPSKRYRHWKRPSQCSNETNQNQNTKLQNTPQVINAGSELQVCIQLKSRIYSTMKPKESTTKIKSWATRWRKFSNRTPIYQTKLPKSTKPLRRSSRRTPLWLWSQRRYPPICSLDTAATEKPKPKQKTSPGENLSSKRRSESESYNHRKRQRLNSKSESESRNKDHCQYEKQNFKSENKIKNKDVKAVKVRSKEALTKIRAQLTAKVNEVKAIEKTLTGSRIEREKQLNEKIGSEPTITLPSRFTAMFNISIFIYVSIIFTIFIFNNFISISNSIVSDPLDHHFQTFTVGKLSDCKTLCLSQQTASV